MNWTFYAALVIVIIAILSLLLWHPKDDLDEAIKRYVRWQIFKGRK